ncbi:MAG: stress-responsive transcription factor hsf1 [Pleopsidium flavum]|nr:MAG: stress-responsive transcription factor hsf1 [Pleopsidium flavum]
MPQAGSRKRPAPGASPLVQQQSQTAMHFPQKSPQLSNEQFLRWGQNPPSNEASVYPDPTTNYSPNIYGGLPHSQGVPIPQSNQITRRSTNQQLVTRGRTFNDTSSDQWSGLGDGSTQAMAEGWVNGDDDLEQKALVAKRDAQAKRKPIPPFVQKLSSFLDESRNTDLIRWSDNGDSFIVLDEDEFAKTLIPELFKHNNYASFVRQLNMYGFHKKVGLSDNSMRASERKNKSPSEYYNPYFKRGHPDLLWLIQKPKNPLGTGGKGTGKGGGRVKVEDRDGVVEDDGEEPFDADSPAPPNQPPGESSQNRTEGGRTGRGPLMIGQGDGSLPQEQLSAVHQELQAIRHQQQVISGAINKIRREHEQLYGQAAAFQSLHDRHESSINAILTFLATVYNRSLEGHGAQNFANMFAGAIPHDTQAQGNIVDFGDYGDRDPNDSNAELQRPFRRQPLLLKAPPMSDHGSQLGRASTASPATSASSPQARPQTRHYAAQNQQYRTQSGPPAQSGAKQLSHSPRVKHGAVPEDIKRIPERDIMTMINNANANNSNSSFPGSPMDFPAALSHFENSNGNSPLTQGERADVLKMIANGTNSAQHGSNNALVSPSPPQMPSMQQWNKSREEFDVLAKLQAEQDSKVQNLTTILQPLSPSGSIPGLTDNQYFGEQGGENGPAPLDLDQIFNSGDYFTDQENGNINLYGHDNHDSGISFSFDDLGNGPNGYNGGSAGDHSGRILETVNSSEATSPANTADDGLQEDGGSPSKRRRRK